MVIGVVVTPTATVTCWPFVSETVTFAVPAASAVMLIVVVSGVAVTDDVTVTTSVLSLDTVYVPEYPLSLTVNDAAPVPVSGRLVGLAVRPGGGAVGVFVGVVVGAVVGVVVGAVVGAFVGVPDGAVVGVPVGALVGALVGDPDGVGVGSAFGVV
jgi:hypothetical protein